MKAIIISDIHLRAYVRYNKFPDQRLFSFLELAKDIVKEGIDRGIKVLIITGDIVDKSTLSPREIHVLFQMFEILASQFEIYGLVGNHDMKLKKGDFEREDSIVTLLEEIPGVKFLHQQTITLGTKTLAFENWMPEFKLDWLKQPVDYYFSHAAIDYDDTGMYGIDLTPFKNKFKLGFFGDIHVRREKGNLISVGNTKQESLSDKHQGGGIVLDIETGDWERFDIDPEHKKYLKLVVTEDKDLEGWKDFEGDSMIYYTFRPAKSSSNKVSFELPKVTDLEAILDSIMKDLNLVKLHAQIKKDSVYTPIDFNFKLKELVISNFRSIKDYTLTFDEDFIITGHNGSGKSTLITALYYALVGCKTIKKDITKGEKDMFLKLTLEYQKQTFVILRGTATGVYGLTINGEERKYNNKNEFEKEVLEYLPFIEYNESFFFNSWDTELLSSVKVDRRFDIISKYYRLDALNSYNDTATAMLKAMKAENKTFVQNLAEKKIVLETRLIDLENSKNYLSNKPSSLELEDIISKHERLQTLKNNLESLNRERESLQNDVNKNQAQVDVLKPSYEEEENALKSAKSKESIESENADYLDCRTLNDRISKGQTLITSVENNINLKSVQILNKKDSLKLIGESSELEKEDPNWTSEGSKLKEEISNLRQGIQEQAISLSQENNRLSLLLEKLNSDKDNLTQPYDCSECGRPVDNKDKLKIITERIKETEKLLKLNNKEQADFEKVKVKTQTKISELESSADELRNKIMDIRKKNEEILRTEKTRNTLLEEISNLEKEKKEQEDKLSLYLSNIEKLQKELANKNSITELEYQENLNTLKLYERFVNTQGRYLIAEQVLDKAKLKLKSFDISNEDDIDEMEKDIKNLLELKLTDVSECNYILRKWEDHEVLANSVKSLQAEYDLAEKEIENVKQIMENLDIYIEVTSRSGSVLKEILNKLTQTFSSDKYRFLLDKQQSTGKTVTDFTMEYRVGKSWLPYSSLSSGQKTMCDLYFINKVVTGVGVICFDETLRFLDDENIQEASFLIPGIKKRNLIISTHSPNLQLEDAVTLKCRLNQKDLTEIQYY